MQQIRLVANLESLWFDMTAISFRNETFAASENLKEKNYFSKLLDDDQVKNQIKVKNSLVMWQ